MPAATPHAGHRERLRSRFLSAGLEGWHDYEVLELLLAYAMPRVDVKPLAKRLDERFGGLAGVLDASAEELSAVEGVGEAAAAYFPLLRASLSRYWERQASLSDAVASPEAAVRYCRALLEGRRNEAFVVLHLSTRNRVVGHEVVSEGSLDRAAVYPRRVIEGALKANAAGLILVHNHPSGDPAPSAEDRALTRELAAAARPLGIAVHDHIVVGRGAYVSFRARGWMGPSGETR